jgi:hypothetical protein
MKNFFLACIILFLFSCERETVIDVPRSKPQIAVSCFLIPEKNIEIYICQSIHIYETKEVPVSDAIVKLYQNNSLLETIPHSENGFYRIDKQPEIGKTYSIEINVPDFETIKANTNIPLPVTIDSAIITRNIGTNENGKPLSYYRMIINSPDTNKTSYYEYIFEALTDSINMFGQVNLGKPFSYDAAIMNEGDIYTKFFSNSLYNNPTFNLNLYFEDPVDFFFGEDTVKFTISSQIYSISKELYLYNKSLKKYNENQNNIWELNNPPLIYSNIENGYGIFAGLSFSNVISEQIVEATK